MHVDYNKVKLEKLVIHCIGNKLLEEGYQLATKIQTFENEIVHKLISTYFLHAFKTQEFYQFFHESNLSLNTAYHFASQIFENSNNLFEVSISLAKHLYEMSTHPKIKRGEFYVAYFSNCTIGEETVDAIGIFKSENKDVFLKISNNNNDFCISTDEGININRLDKGCIIYNTNKEDGFVVQMVDNLSKNNEAQYWKNGFLKIKEKNDEFHQTKNLINLTKRFVLEKLPEEFEVNKTDQVDLLNRTNQFLKQTKNFDIESFEEKVINEPQVIQSFRNYKQQYEIDNELKIMDEFTISEPAMKKQQKVFRSVIKLDKNFHLYIHGNRNMIERGYDPEQKLNYYKLFFKEES